MGSGAAIRWSELVSLMVLGTGVEPAVSGVIAAQWLEDDVPASRTMRVRMQGQLLRVETLDGRPELIEGEKQRWRFADEDEPPVVSEQLSGLRSQLPPNLFLRRAFTDFDHGDYVRPLGLPEATEFLGRPAWRVDLEPPADDPHLMSLTVDAETGLLLQCAVPGKGAVEAWAEFAVVEPFGPETFIWAGPAVSAEERHRGLRSDRVERDRQERAWFEENVAALPLTYEVSASIELRDRDDTTGAFTVTLGGVFGMGTLTRVPVDAPDDARDISPFDEDDNPDEDENPGHHTVTWTTSRWRYQLTLYDVELTPAGLESLRRQLPD